jgi:hypothetical protein
LILLTKHRVLSLNRWKRAWSKAHGPFAVYTSRIEAVSTLRYQILRHYFQLGGDVLISNPESPVERDVSLTDRMILLNQVFYDLIILVEKGETVGKLDQSR